MRASPKTSAEVRMKRQRREGKNLTAAAPYKLHPRIDQFFREFVIRPFEEHERSGAWVKEVINRKQSYRTMAIIDRGRADFSLGWKGLTPRDKVLIYCYYYMQMHVVSGFHVFQLGAKTTI